MYVQCGDDEESWAEGLPPHLFWEHHQVRGEVWVRVCVVGAGGVQMGEVEKAHF